MRWNSSAPPDLGSERRFAEATNHPGMILGANGRSPVSQLVNDHTIYLGKLADDFTGISFALFLDQSIDEIDSIVPALEASDEPATHP